MRIDLQKDSKKLRKHLAQRVREYPLYINQGPGRDEAPIKQVTVGYQFDQSGWMAVVFDTRPNARRDGNWNAFIDPNAIEFGEWHKAFSGLVDRGSPIELKLPDGTTKRLGVGTSAEALAAYIGAAIRDVLIGVRDDGLLGSLPIAPDCSLVVEEQDGCYGWSERVETDAQTEEAYLAQLEGNVASKTPDGQATHWVGVLERVASGTENESEWSFLATDFALTRLKGCGDRGIVPILKFVRKWADKPEFDGDRPKRAVNALPMQGPTIDALMLVCESSYRTAETERLLRDILQRAVRANAGRTLWGIIPVWAARCLSRHSPKYPKPKQHASTNELVNRREYTGAGRKSH